MKTKALSGLVIAAIVVGGLVYVKATTSKSVTTSVPIRTAEDIRLGLPADPGEAGKVTLEGIDSDNDGVRDDVQRWIAFTFPTSARSRAALKQSAIALQRRTISGERLVSGIDDVRYGYDCYDSFHISSLEDVKGAYESNKIHRALETVVFNTSRRIKRNAVVDSSQDGAFVASPITDLDPVTMRKHCLFDWSTLPN